MLSTDCKSKNNILWLAQGGLVEDSIVDGPGLRWALFVQGCPHKCPFCHNPKTHPFAGGQAFTVDEIETKIIQNPLNKGVTFSGGEPFCQAGPLALLAGRLATKGYEIAAYSGYTFEELLNGDCLQKLLLSRLDILIDGRFLQGQKTADLPFRGSANQRVLNVHKSLAQKKAVDEKSSRWGQE